MSTSLFTKAKFVIAIRRPADHYLIVMGEADVHEDVAIKREEAGQAER